MKTIAMLLGFVSCLTVGVIAGARSTPAPAKAEIGTTTVDTSAAATPSAEEMKSCTNNSECPFGGCSGGHCGSCSNNAECKGWGGCSGGHCGSCSNNADCGKFGDCSGGHCTKSPY